MSLNDYGWNSFFEQEMTPYRERGLHAGRVILQTRRAYRLAVEGGEAGAKLPGRFHRRGADPAAVPVIGDWVVVSGIGNEGKGDEVKIEAALPRRTRISRKAAGGAVREQVVAANVDTVLLVMGLDGDYNLRRLERFLAAVWEGGVRPVVLLNKEDLDSSAGERLRETRRAAPGAPVHAMSALEGKGLEALEEYLEPGRTVALIGSSGAGKSTLINRLAGRELLRTAEVRAGDDRGRHTTTHRELVKLADGALLIDNPGMREFQPWSAGQGLSRGLGETFGEIEALAEECRFRDCGHQGEPGCAVQAAVEDGRLDEGRLGSHNALEKERAYLQRRQDHGAQLAEKRRWKEIHKAVKEHKKRQF